MCDSSCLFNVTCTVSFFRSECHTHQGHYFEAIPSKKIKFWGHHQSNSLGKKGIFNWTENPFNVRYSQCAFLVGKHIELMVLSSVWENWENFSCHRRRSDISKGSKDSWWEEVKLFSSPWMKCVAQEKPISVWKMLQILSQWRFLGSVFTSGIWAVSGWTWWLWRSLFPDDPVILSLHELLNLDSWLGTETVPDGTETFTALSLRQSTRVKLWAEVSSVFLYWDGFIQRNLNLIWTQAENEGLCVL